METGTKFDFAIALETVCHQSMGLGRLESETLLTLRTGTEPSVRTNPERDLWSGRAADLSDQCGGLIEHDEEM